MQRVQWRAPELVGKLVLLRVVDGHNAGWGHITFDDFRARGAVDAMASERAFADYRSVLDQLKAARMPSPGDPTTLAAAIADLTATFGADYPRARRVPEASR